MIQYSNEEKAIRLSLIRMGIDSSTLGYDYLVLATKYYNENPADTMYNICTRVAEFYNSSENTVNKNIRLAISFAMLRFPTVPRKTLAFVKTASENAKKIHFS